MDGVTLGAGHVLALLEGISYLGGIVLSIKAARRFKEHLKRPQSRTVTQPLLWAVLSGLLIALPAILATGPSHFWETGSPALMSVGALPASVATIQKTVATAPSAPAKAIKIKEPATMAECSRA